MKNKINCGNILQEIDEISDKINSYISKLLALSIHSKAEIRLRSLEALECIRTQDVENRVRDGLSDSDELVRATCLEILGSWQDKHSADKITKCMSDESWLVRSEAAIALSEIGDNRAVAIIKEKLAKAGDEEKVSYCFALYRMGEYEYLYLFLEGLFHEYYRVRCATANLSEGIVTPCNQGLIMNLLLSALRNEKTEAAISSLKNAINSIKAKTEGWK